MSTKYLDISKDEFDTAISEFCDRYYNSGDSIPDSEYDGIMEIYQSRFGVYKSIGAPIRGEKYTLPVFMPSLDKIKTLDELNRWNKKYKKDFIVTNKIDGVSALYDGEKMYTRGDGTKGSDISFMIEFFNLPSSSKKYTIRGEIYMRNSVFKEFSDKFSNSRNIVTGLLNPLTKKRDKHILSRLSFIAYEYNDENGPYSPIEQFNTLETLKIETPQYVRYDKIDIDFLKREYTNRRENCDYEIDGLVVYHNSIEKKTLSNPKNTIAFKVRGDEVETVVDLVEWNISKNSVLKPRIKITPVNIGGVNINWTSGFNAKFIVDNRIGRGSIVKLTRSGDVIPYITEIVTTTEPDIPRSEEYDYKWNDTRVDFILLESTNESRKKRIIDFFKTIECKFLGESTVNRLFDNGFDTINKIIKIKMDDLLKIEGIKKKGAERILSSIHDRIRDCDISKIYAGSGTLGAGFGVKKIEKVFDEYPNLLKCDLEEGEIEKLLKELGGFQKTARYFAANLVNLREFMNSNKEINRIRSSKVDIVFLDSESEIENEKIHNEKIKNEKIDSLRGKTIVFTGIRDNSLESKLKRSGASVKTSVSKKTDILVTLKRFSSSSKEITADKLGVRVMEIEQFKKEYDL